MQRIYLIGLLLSLSLYVFAQDKDKGIGRGGELFPYPYKHFSYVQPRFDRTNYGSGEYINGYYIRAARTFSGYNHLRLETSLGETNTGGRSVFGLMDTRLRLLHSIRLIDDKFFLGFGGELTMPTATDRELGSGKWQIRPEAGLIYFFGNKDDIKGTAMIGLDYRFDFAGQSNREHISVLGIVPNIDYWAEKWYIGYYATWTYDFKREVFDLPLDVEAGYTFIPHWTVAIEYIRPLLSQAGYNSEIAAKIRYMF